jgi:hypothetical protein
MRVWSFVVVVSLLSGAVGCTAGDPPTPGPASSGPLLDAATVRAAFLQPADIGPTWRPPAQTPEPNPLVRFCAGEAPVPPVPGSPSTVAVPLVDEGTQGAQTLSQVGLVYADPAAAQAGLAALRAVAEACPAEVAVPAKTGLDRQEPAYTETFARMPLDEGGWSGLVVERHKRYEPTHPGTADTAVAIVAKRNVVVVDAYAVFRLGQSSAAPQFASDWRKLVGTPLSRLR